MKQETIRQWLAGGPFTLALSSSFFGFYAHCGVVEVLWEEGLLPIRITGSSAGALVGGAVSSGLSPAEARKLLFDARKPDFWDPAPGLGLLRGRKFLQILEENYVASFDQTRIPIEVAAFDLFSCRTKFLKEGSLPKAIVASCAVPFLFHPVRIGNRLFLDGGVFHKSGISLAHPEERTLCIFLQNDGLADSYEWGRSLGQLGVNQRVLRFKNLPRVDYNSLDRGPLAHIEAMRRTRKALSAKITETIFDA